MNRCNQLCAEIVARPRPKNWWHVFVFFDMLGLWVSKQELMPRLNPLDSSLMARGEAKNPRSVKKGEETRASWKRTIKNFQARGTIGATLFFFSCFIVQGEAKTPRSVKKREQQRHRGGRQYALPSRRLFWQVYAEHDTWRARKFKCISLLGHRSFFNPVNHKSSSSAWINNRKTI